MITLKGLFAFYSRLCALLERTLRVLQGQTSGCLLTYEVISLFNPSTIYQLRVLSYKSRDLLDSRNNFIITSSWFLISFIYVFDCFDYSFPHLSLVKRTHTLCTSSRILINSLAYESMAMCGTYSCIQLTDFHIFIRFLYYAKLSKTSIVRLSHHYINLHSSAKSSIAINPTYLFCFLLG